MRSLLRANLPGVLLGAAALAAGPRLASWWVAQELLLREAMPLAGAASLLALGVLARLFGARPAVLGVPVWLLGFGFLSFKLMGMGGGWTATGVLLALAAVVAGLGMLGMRQARDEWAAAPPALVAAKDALLFDDRRGLWRQLEIAWFVPLGEFTPDQCRHDLAVLTLVLAQLSPGSREGDLEQLRQLEELLRTGAAGGKPCSIPHRLVLRAQSVIRREVAWCEAAREDM